MCVLLLCLCGFGLVFRILGVEWCLWYKCRYVVVICFGVWFVKRCFVNFSFFVFGVLFSVGFVMMCFFWCLWIFLVDGGVFYLVVSLVDFNNCCVLDLWCLGMIRIELFLCFV